jgi:hypothetical protein
VYGLFWENPDLDPFSGDCERTPFGMADVNNNELELLLPPPGLRLVFDPVKPDETNPVFAERLCQGRLRKRSNVWRKLERWTHNHFQSTRTMTLRSKVLEVGRSTARSKRSRRGLRGMSFPGTCPAVLWGAQSDRVWRRGNNSEILKSALTDKTYVSAH